MLKLRVRSPRQTAPAELEVPSDIPWNELLLNLSELSGIEATRLRVLQGFPPKPIEPPQSSATLKELGLRPNALLICQEGEPRIEVINTGERYIPFSHERARFSRRNVPADNSCLFHSCAYVLKDRSRSDGPSLRQVCAEYILNHPEKIKACGEDPVLYAQWILHPSNWGGHIELSILSDVFQTELIVLDGSTNHIIHCGEEHHYPARAFLFYTGQHYDALSMSHSGNIVDESKDQVLFNPRDIAVFERAKEFLNEQRDSI